ncbi:MAG: hypothetical protein DMG12_14450, partial [Acidobacteria bacterium]
NEPGAGNFHVYNSLFRNSTLADLSMGNTGGFSARGNYSTGSKAFFVATGTNNPATIHLQSNTVIDPIDSVAIRLGNQGPGLITDNVIRSSTSATGPVIYWTNLFAPDVASIGNTFTVANLITTNGRLIRIDDRVVARRTLTPKEPALPGTPPNLHRQIFEVPPGATASAMQQAINAAAAQNGNRPVVHIPYGTYSVSQTLTLPVSDVQLAGDGYETILNWTGEGNGPVLSMSGPSKATLREIQIDGAAEADGIVLDNVDQIGSRVYMQGVQLRSGRRTDLFINGLDHTRVQLEDFGHAYSPNAVSVKVRGGPLSAAGKATGGKTSVFSGASSGNSISYEVSEGARLLVRDLWYESGAKPGFAKIYDRALFTLDGVRISSPVNQIPAALDIVNLNGTVAILTSHLDDRITISGNGSGARILGLGIFDEQRSSKYFLNDSSPAAQAVLANSRQVSTLPGNRSVGTPDMGVADRTFIKSLLEQTRGEHPAVPRALPIGITDVRMFRVWVGNGRNNITLAAR